MGGSHATRLFFGFPLVQQRERRQLIPLTLEGLNAFRRRLLERANIPIPQTGLIRRPYIEAMAGYPQDARVDDETQGPGSQRSCSRRCSVREERPGTPRPGVRQAVQRRMEQIPQCRLETVDPDFSCPHRYWKGGGSCVTCSSAPAMRCVMWPVVSAALFLAAARAPQAPDI